MVAPRGVYLDSSFQIDRSHVTKTTFAAMIFQPFEVCPLQDPDCSMGEFAVHPVSADTAEVFVCRAEGSIETLSTRKLLLGICFFLRVA